MNDHDHDHDITNPSPITNHQSPFTIHTTSPAHLVGQAKQSKDFGLVQLFTVRGSVPSGTGGVRVVRGRDGGTGREGRGVVQCGEVKVPRPPRTGG